MTETGLSEGGEGLPEPRGVIDTIVTMVEKIALAISAIAIFALMITAVFQVVARYAFNAPIPGYIDYVEQASAILAFLAVGYAEHVGAHIRMEVLPQQLSGRARRIVESFGLVIGILLFSALVYATWFNFLRAWQLGDTSMDIQLPVWPSKLIVPVAFAFLLLRMLISLIREMSGSDLSSGYSTGLDAE